MNAPGDLKRTLESLKHLLEDWTRWQRGYTMRLGYPTHSPGFSGNQGIRSFDDLCDEVDTRVMQMIDAAIGDLPPAQSAALLRCYGVAAVFRFPRENYEEQLFAAHEHLLQELPRRGVVL